MSHEVCADCGTATVHGSCTNPDCPGRRDQRRIEFAREFINAVPADDVMPWDIGFHGEPDLSQPPPPVNGQPTRWVTRTVTYSPWRPLTDAGRRVAEARGHAGRAEG